MVELSFQTAAFSIAVASVLLVFIGYALRSDHKKQIPEDGHRTTTARKAAAATKEASAGAVTNPSTAKVPAGEATKGMVEIVTVDDVIAPLLQIYRVFDEDRNGTIDAGDLIHIFLHMGYSPSRLEVQRMIDAADLNHDGHVDFPEFVALTSCMHQVHNQQKAPANTIHALKTIKKAVARSRCTWGKLRENTRALYHFINVTQQHRPSAEQRRLAVAPELLRIRAPTMSACDNDKFGEDSAVAGRNAPHKRDVPIEHVPQNQQLHLSLTNASPERPDGLLPASALPLPLQSESLSGSIVKLDPASYAPTQPSRRIIPKTAKYAVKSEHDAHPAGLPVSDIAAVYPLPAPGTHKEQTLPASTSVIVPTRRLTSAKSWRKAASPGRRPRRGSVEELRRRSIVVDTHNKWEAAAESASAAVPQPQRLQPPRRRLSHYRSWQTQYGNNAKDILAAFEEAAHIHLIRHADDHGSDTSVLPGKPDITVDNYHLHLAKIHRQ